MKAGYLLRQLQNGELLGMPHSRPMPGIGPRCQELRIRDENRIWRIVYRLDNDAIVVAGVFPKTTRTTSKRNIESCQKRLSQYDQRAGEGKKGNANE